MYQEYAKKLIASGLPLEFKVNAAYNTGRIFNKDGTVYLDFKTYRNIIKRFNSLAIMKLTNGYAIRMDKIGNLFVVLIERHINNKAVDRAATRALHIALKAEGKVPGKKDIVYYTDNDFIKLMWNKTLVKRNTLNGILYEFKTAGGLMGLRTALHKAVKRNPTIKMFYPFIKQNYDL